MSATTVRTWLPGVNPYAEVKFRKGTGEANREYLNPAAFQPVCPNNVTAGMRLLPEPTETSAGTPSGAEVVAVRRPDLAELPDPRESDDDRSPGSIQRAEPSGLQSSIQLNNRLASPQIPEAPQLLRRRPLVKSHQRSIKPASSRAASRLPSKPPLFRLCSVMPGASDLYRRDFEAPNLSRRPLLYLPLCFKPVMHAGFHRKANLKRIPSWNRIKTIAGNF